MIKINMGCGKRNFGKDWIHIDGENYEHLDYFSITDLSQFTDGSVDLIYASHVIEYFDRENIVPVLNEWYRVLKPGGILRLAVPNFEIMSSLYCQKKYELDKFLGLLYGKMSMRGKVIYHKTVYDFESLSSLLIEQIGFNVVKYYDWRKTEHSCYDDHSQAYLPHMDKDSGILMSLNMEAVK
jgi:predicted SAM-dependent methyltransferase